jgi:tRNA(adenine34) deaminase
VNKPKLFTNRDNYWMQRALALAASACEQNEVPVGAVLVKDDVLVAEAANAPIAEHDPTAHAEIRVLRLAGLALQNYRLPDTTLYVTLEPCPMCAAAMVHARVKRLVYGTADPRTGAAGSVFNLIQAPQLNHQLDCEGGVLAGDCAQLLREFFQARR